MRSGEFDHTYNPPDEDTDDPWSRPADRGRAGREKPAADRVFGPGRVVAVVDDDRHTLLPRRPRHRSGIAPDEQERRPAARDAAGAARWSRCREWTQKSHSAGRAHSLVRAGRRRGAYRSLAGGHARTIADARGGDRHRRNDDGVAGRDSRVAEHRWTTNCGFRPTAP